MDTDQSSLSIKPNDDLPITCPQCGRHFLFAPHMTGERFTCTDCGAVFDLIAPHPPKLGAQIVTGPTAVVLLVMALPVLIDHQFAQALALASGALVCYVAYTVIDLLANILHRLNHPKHTYGKPTISR